MKKYFIYSSLMMTCLFILVANLPDFGQGFGKTGLFIVLGVITLVAIILPLLFYWLMGVVRPDKIKDMTY